MHCTYKTTQLKGALSNQTVNHTNKEYKINQYYSLLRKTILSHLDKFMIKISDVDQVLLFAQNTVFINTVNNFFVPTVALYTVLF